MAEKRYIKTWASLEDARKTVGGPDLSLGVGTNDLYALITAGISSGDIDVTPDLGDTVVTTTDTQTISGAKTFSSVVTTSAGIAGGASADITLNTNKFTVDATQGNTVIGGTLSLTGALLCGEITADTTSDIALGDGSAAGNATIFTVSDVNGRVSTTGDITMIESVAAPATSSSYSIKSKQIVHATTAAATNVIAINIPVGARIVGAQILASLAIVLAGGGVTWSATWTAATQAIGAAGQAVTKNTKVKALFDASTDSPIVAGSVETITITPNAGTIDTGGEFVVTAWYEELSDLASVA